MHMGDACRVCTHCMLAAYEQDRAVWVLEQADTADVRQLVLIMSTVSQNQIHHSSSGDQSCMENPLSTSKKEELDCARACSCEGVPCCLWASGARVYRPQLAAITPLEI